MTWTYEEFENRMAIYWTAMNTRNNKFLKLFFSLVGCALVAISLLLSNIMSKPIAALALILVVVALCFLGIYIIATSKAFHSKYGVFCPLCSTLLITLGDTIDEYSEDKRELPPNMECPKCHATIIKTNA